MPSFDTLLGDPALFALLALASFIVGLSKGGLPAVGMLSVPLLSLIMSPLVAAVLLLPIFVLSDLVGVYLYRKEYSRENLKVLIPAGILGVLVGWGTAAYVTAAMVSLLIGIMGIVFCLHRWFGGWLSGAEAGTRHHKEPTQPSTAKGLFWGTLSGFTSFVSHAGAPPFQVYVLPQQLPKMVFAGTTTILFAIVNLAKVIPYWSLHPYTLSTLKVSAVLLPLAAVGTVIGRQLIRQLSEKWFYLAVQIALFMISIRLVMAAF